MSAKAVLLFCMLLVTRLGQLDLGARLDRGQVPKRSKASCASGPSQTYPCISLTLEGVKFTVGYDEKSLLIKYLSTQDKNFRTPEGLQVGAVMTMGEDQLMAVPGWKVLGPRAKSGWRPVLGDMLLNHQVQFSDGTVIDLTQPHQNPPRTGELVILELEKGGV